MASRCGRRHAYRYRVKACHPSNVWIGREDYLRGEGCALWLVAQVGAIVFGWLLVEQCQQVLLDSVADIFERQVA